MNGVEGDERIEIELTPSSPRRPPPPSPDAGDDPERHVDASDLATPVRDGAPRGRVAALVVGVGLGALLLGWILGRAETDGASADAPAGATTDGASDDQDEPDEAGSQLAVDTVPAADIAPATTERPPRTTTTLPPTETTVIEIAPRLADVPLELVGPLASPAGSLVTVDLAFGMMTLRHDVDLSWTNGAPSTLFAGPGWVVLPDWNTDSRATVIDDDADPISVNLGAPWELVESATPGEFWRMDEQQPIVGLTRTAELVDRYGEPIGPSLDLPFRQSLAFADPLGGLVVNTPSGGYSVTPDGASRIIDGTVIAIGRDRALGHRCDEQLMCGYVVVDRDNGEVAPVELDENLPQAGIVSFGGGRTATVAPDGHTAAATWLDSTSGSPRLGLIDLDTGSVTELSESGNATLEWSPDGRFAFYLDVGLPMAHDLTTGESFAVADDLPRLSGLAVRLSTSDAPAN